MSSAKCRSFCLGLSVTGDPLHSRALTHSRAPLLTQPCPHCSHSRAPAEQWARLCVFTLQGCVQAARLCRGSPVSVLKITCSRSLGETAWWLQQPSSPWPRRRKCSKMFSLCTTRITRTILLGCIWILDFHFKIVLVLRRRYLIPIRCNNGKRKIWPWHDGCTILIFSIDDGCPAWWGWLHQFLCVCVNTQPIPCRQICIGCMIVVRSLALTPTRLYNDKHCG